MWILEQVYEEYKVWDVDSKHSQTPWVEKDQEKQNIVYAKENGRQEQMWEEDWSSAQ